MALTLSEAEAAAVKAKAAIVATVGPWAAKQAAWIAVHPTTTLWYALGGVAVGAWFGKHFGGILPF